LIHYLGKIVLPVNLSVFPMLEDTSAVFGLVALALIILLVYLGKEKKRRVIIAGALVYTLFFIPALLVPASLNDQDFEHRTYVPMLGVLLVLSETALFRNSLRESSVLIIGLAICIVLSVMNLNHQKNFKDPVTFWKAAVETSPNSAYANMMLGARIDETDRSASDALIRKSYRIDSAAKYINYYMGVLLQQHDSVIESEPYFLKELQKSDYYMCYFHLARVAFEKQDRAAAIAYLETYLNRVPGDPQANNNLLLLYLETGQPDKARVVADRMKNFGLTVPPEAEKQMQSQKLPADSL
jgi:tetratricopeptide (TPR) repeat protein